MGYILHNTWQVKCPLGTYLRRRYSWLSNPNSLSPISLYSKKVPQSTPRALIHTFKPQTKNFSTTTIYKIKENNRKKKERNLRIELLYRTLHGLLSCLLLLYGLYSSHLNIERDLGSSLTGRGSFSNVGHFKIIVEWEILWNSNLFWGHLQANNKEFHCQGNQKNTHEYNETNKNRNNSSYLPFEERKYRFCVSVSDVEAKATGWTLWRSTAAIPMEVGSTDTTAGSELSNRRRTGRDDMTVFSLVKAALCWFSYTKAAFPFSRSRRGRVKVARWGQNLSK